MPSGCEVGTPGGTGGGGGVRSVKDYEKGIHHNLVLTLVIFNCPTVQIMILVQYFKVSKFSALFY